MVITEDLLVEVVSIVTQHPLNRLDPVVKDEFQFRLVKVTQKFLNARRKILSPGELLSCRCRVYVPKKSEVRRCQARTVRRMGHSNNRIFSEQVLRGL
jgi:hypothetical protein